MYSDLVGATYIATCSGQSASSLEEHLQGNPCIKIASVILGYALNGALNT
jgi:hypothetical protein